jgi:DNA-binding transcriptional LysR family regulator
MGDSFIMCLGNELQCTVAFFRKKHQFEQKTVRGTATMGRFTELETFVRVVESGSFTHAAERLGVAKSVVSRRLSELEERLRVRLLNRTTRRLSLTDGGQQLYERALRLLIDLEEAEQTLAAGHDALRGRIRVAAPLSFGLQHLTAAVDDFLRAHPELILDLDLDDREVNLVEDGFDLALRIGHLDDSTLVARRFAPIRMITCASPDYLRLHGTPLQPEDLAAHHGLVYTNISEGQLWKFHDREGKARTVRVPARLHANNGEVLLSAAIRGLGVVVSPTFIAYRAIESGELKPILTDFTLPLSAAYAVYPSHRHLSRRVRVFIDALAERFGDTPYWDECLRARK